MSVRYYDEALCKKINEWITIPELKVWGPDKVTELFAQIADEKYDSEIVLPLITLTRDNQIELIHPHKNPMSFDGIMLEAQGAINKEFANEIKANPNKYPGWSVIKNNKSKDPGYSYSLNAIPMKIKYQLDIYTRYSDDGDEFMRNFIFNFVNSPKLVIDIPYNGLHLSHVGNVFVSSTVTSNDDTDIKIFHDQLTRWSLGLTIDDAYLFSIPKYNNVVIDLDKTILEAE